MQRYYCLSVLIAVLGLAEKIAQAAEDDSNVIIRLICAYSHSINEKAEQRGTSGEDLFTIIPLKEGGVAVKKEGLGAQFMGIMTDEEITADVSYEVGNVKIAQSLIINRFTGAFQISFGAPSRPGLVHFGKCRLVTKPLF